MGQASPLYLFWEVQPLPLSLLTTFFTPPHSTILPLFPILTQAVNPLSPYNICTLRISLKVSSQKNFQKGSSQNTTAPSVFSLKRLQKVSVQNTTCPSYSMLHQPSTGESPFATA